MAKTQSPTFKHRLEAFALLSAGWFLTRLPYGLSMRLARFIGTLISFTPVRSRVVRENLELAFGSSISKAEKVRLYREAYRSLCIFAVEGFFLERKPTEWIRRLIEVDGLDNLLRATQDPRGFILVTGHLGNWEYGGAWIGSVQSCAALAKSLHNPIVQARLEKTRKKHGLEIIWADQPDALRQIVKAMQSDRRLIMLTDQDAGVEGVFVPFFGKQASTTATPALMAIRHNMPILLTTMVRESLTSHRWSFCARLDPAELAPGTREEQVHELTAMHTAALEETVRRYPEQYFWFHRRWKTTPEFALAKLEKRHRKKSRKIESLKTIAGDERPEV